MDYYNSLGLLYASREKFQEADWAFQKALKLDSGCADASYNLALSLTAQGRLDEAIDCYTRVIRLKPDFYVVAETKKQICSSGQGLNQHHH